MTSLYSDLCRLSKNTQNKKQGDHIFGKLNSLSFPWVFQDILNFFPEQLKREKFDECIFVSNYVTCFSFSLSFPGFFYKSSNFPKFSLRFWQFFKFSEFSRFVAEKNMKNSINSIINGLIMMKFCTGVAQYNTIPHEKKITKSALTSYCWNLSFKRLYLSNLWMKHGQNW